MARQCKNFRDVITLLNEWHYDFIYEYYSRIAGKHVLVFMSRYNETKPPVNIQHFIGSKFNACTSKDRYITVTRASK